MSKLTAKQRTTLEKYAIKPNDYDLSPYGSTKEEYIKAIQRVANVANKRYKALVKADKAGTITIKNTAVKRYYEAVKTYQKLTGKTTNYISRGLTPYADLSVTKLRQIERDIVHFLTAESSTVTGAKEVQRRQNSFLESIGIDVSKTSAKDIATIFRLLNIRKAQMNEKVYASQQELRAIVNASKKTTYQEIMEIANTATMIIQTNSERGDLIINLVRASKLQGDERKRAYKEGLRIKHMKEPEKPKTVKQKWGKK